jgi:acyl-CoA hydrolase
MTMHTAPKHDPLMSDASGDTRFVEMIFPEQANHYGTLFGGTALSLMGKAAFVAASRRARCAVVMAASDKVEFHSPVAVGQLVELAAHVTRVGRTSMTVDVAVIVETLTTGERRPAMRGQFEMVAVDARGGPVPIDPQLLSPQKA